MIILVSFLSNSAKTDNNPSQTSNGLLQSCDFEIFGTVQGVYFRHHTQQEAKKLNLVGWVKNTEIDTVQGHMQGQKTDVDTMKNWLQTTGSPKSKISKAVFTHDKSILKLTENTFNIRREK
jgi:acylphosphatase